MKNMFLKDSMLLVALHFVILLCSSVHVVVCVCVVRVSVCVHLYIYV